MTEITMTREFGKDVFSFNANKTDYTVMTEDNNTFEVWSTSTLRRVMPTIKFYNSIEELAKRSKAFKNLATLIQS